MRPEVRWESKERESGFRPGLMDKSGLRKLEEFSKLMAGRFVDDGQ